MATAQQKPADEPLVLRSTTRLVQLNVVATEKGVPAKGLTKDAFTVLDNGKPQQIGLFSVEMGAQPGGTPQKAPPNVFTNLVEQKIGTPGGGVTILLFDSLNTNFADRGAARAQIIKYLKTIQPEDRIALYTFGRGIRVLHDYTTSSRELINKLAKYRGDNLPELAASEQTSFDPDAFNIEAFLMGESNVSQLEADYFTKDRTLGTLRALRLLADHLAGIPGRKNLIWVSGGFPLAIGFDYSVDMRDTRRANRSFGPETTETVRALTNANVAIYPVDARGLMGDPLTNASINFNVPNAFQRPQFAPPGVKEQQAMQELAERTGGKAYYNTNELSKAIRDAVNDTALSYTIGFYPKDERFDGKFHTLKVKVDRPGVSLRYRAGYVDSPKPAQTPELRKQALNDSIFNPLNATEIGLAVEVKEVGPKLDLTVRIDTYALTFTRANDKWVGGLDFLFVQKDDEGRPSNERNDTLNFNLSDENYRRLIRDGLAFRQQVDRAPKQTELRIIVRDAQSGATGSVTVPFSQIVKR